MSTLGNAVIATAITELRLRDPGYTGTIDNRSPRVDVYLRYNGRLPSDPNTSGDKWCGHFVRWCYGQNGYTLPHQVSGGRALKNYGDSNPSWVIWRAGDPPCPLEAGDIFVTATLRHVAMVERLRSGGDSFDAIEGNQTDPAHPEWGSRGVQRKRRPFTDCAMILRPPARQ
jgi:hypothetical protein